MESFPDIFQKKESKELVKKDTVSWNAHEDKVIVVFFKR